MDLQPKTPRKRVANFTADEKALLAQLIKKRPIVESKLTHGKSVAKKQAAWDLITQEFNCNANVHKRQTITLKRAWDNMKAFTRKARATERGHLFRTGGGPHAPSLPPQRGAIISMVEDAAPVMICEIQNSLDSDGTILNAIDDSQELEDFLKENSFSEMDTSLSIDTLDIINKEKKMESEKNTSIEIQKKPDISLQIEEKQNSTDPIIDQTSQNYPAVIKTNHPVHRPTDYIRREAVMRIKHLENKKNIEMQILKTQLQAEEIKKNTALLEEERSKILLQKAKLEFEELKKSVHEKLLN